MEYKDYYQILGVNRKASADEIKQAYRRLARKYHPDVSKEANAEEQFKNVKEAYEVLKDTDKRAAYDQLGSNWKAGQDFRPPPDWESQFQSRNAPHQGFTEEDLSGFSDFFSHLFRGGSASGFGREDFAGFKQRGQDQQAKINITLEEAFQGCTKTIQLAMPGVAMSGQVQPEWRTIKVTIPKGTLQGRKLRLAGQGEPGMGGAPSGDLYLEVHVEHHPLFSLEGRDIYLTLPVTPWEAALGAQIKVPTLGGPVELKLSADTEGGKKLRLKGRGMPEKEGAGDQYVIVQIEIPKAKTAEEKHIYEQMAKTMPFNPRKAWPV
ncbi:MAG: cytochrome C biogenesis protein [Gammaproteobacteria bacterium RIFCSPHIGHO2_12_FULL_38_14]|nr:MAG: cytochrome C biogenesis protein [Gammaproteobacteria bacterium RIFCSPHIGHO2_12_FULL_38_14]